ncbi:MAG: ferrous iron transport protein B [Spirochaetaceae bacterium]|jgi:ferrous iron transport protein B|nr:ferrous iron transport protein B [Spirochaetaceae bacterium]
MSIRIALAGNPNSGKTTIFNELTGANQYVGNWPGVTVEKKEGTLKGNRDVIITDLPGIYSLSPYTPEEVVTRKYLLEEKPDVIINIIDASNIERNLYLTTQLLETGIPVVIALNMMDVVRKKGDKIDTKKLSAKLGCPVVETMASRNEGVREAAAKALEAAAGGAGSAEAVPPVFCRFSAETEEVLSVISSLIEGRTGKERIRWYAVKLFERDRGGDVPVLPEADRPRIEQLIKGCEETFDDDSESIITNERYEWISELLSGCVIKGSSGLTASDKIDRIVTNRFLALPLFAVVMFIVYFVSVSWLGAIATDWMNDTFFAETLQPAAAKWLESIDTAEWLRGLVVDSIIGGVGAVLGFVPQLLILFFFLSILEDCGYMARVAFIMDRIFRSFGLSGKSFIPLLISSGCGVPGIMAARTIENEKDRRMTIMLTTFIPCGAKLPIIAFFAGAFFRNSLWVAPSMYFLGIAMVIFSGIVLKKTNLFAGDTAPFVMELPRYHIPSIKGVLIHMWNRAKAFIIKAGTVIFISCGVVWFLSSFGAADGQFGFVDSEDSILAIIGNVIAPIFRPLGFGNWQAAMATITGLVAKENVVGTFGVLLGLGEAAKDDPSLLSNIAALFTGVTAMSFMVFNLLCAPCFAAIGAIRHEMGTWKWTFIAVGYQTLLAYAAALVVYQFGSLFFAGASFGVGTVFAILVLLIAGWLLIRRDPAKKQPARAM